jgi:tetratricopeptide (TPR) repeat protein
LELRDFQLQLARLSLSIPEEQETSMNTLRSVFDTAELFNNHEGLRVVSNYIDENLTLDENKTTYPAYLLSAFYIKGLQAYRTKNNGSALKYLTPVWKNRDSSFNSIKDAGIASHLIGLIYSKNKGMFSEAEYAYKESLKLRVPVNDKYGLAQVYHSLGNLYKDHDKITDAENVYLKSIETGNEINHNHHLAQVYHSLGNLYSKDKNKFKEAESAYLQSLSLLKKLDDKYGLAQVYHSLGNLYSKDRNKFKEAESKYLQSLKLDLANNNNNGLAQVYTSYGKLKCSQRDFKLAKELFEKALKLETSIYFIDMLKKLIKDLPT